MRLTITTLEDHILNVDVHEELEVENLKAQCEFELGIPAANIVFMWNGRPLHDGKMSLKAYGISNGDMILLQQMRGNPSPQATQSGGGFPSIDFSSINVPGASRPTPVPSRSAGLEDPLVIRELIRNNPHERALLKERNPPLSEALESGSVERFKMVYERQRAERLNKEREQNRLLHMDPFDPEAQKLIAEEIRLKNVESNMESAIEFVPESFGQVVMLYVDCHVNGHPVKAFVDSGAQMTIMSQACAERCSIMRLVDTRWAGVAKGVGTQKIIGRVHLGQIQIGKDFLQSSFSILEDQPMDMLLGLDMLKRHQCVIDLQQNVLIIGTTKTQTPFLAESELPTHARGNHVPADEDQQLAEAMRKSAQEASGGADLPTPNRSDGTNNSNNSNVSASSSSSSNTANSSVPPSSAQTPAGASGAQKTFPEEVIRRLVQNGFTRHEVLEALTLSSGDEQKALMGLLAKSLKF